MNINQIILKSFSYTLTDSESIMLNEWLSENDENRKSYLTLKQLHTLGRMRSSITSPNDDVIISFTKENIMQHISTKRDSFNRRWFMKYAAILVGLIVLCAGGYFAVKYEQKKVCTAKMQMKAVHSTVGRFEALLMRGDKVISLNSSKSKMIMEDVIINNNSKDKILSLNNSQVSNKNREQKFYSVVVPKGCRYVVILPDSSEVHLNSDSQLEFPDFFLDTLRKVKLKGEGFFKIKQKKYAPFIVDFKKNGHVRVLGTEFNAKAYEEEDSQITLARGSVIVSSGNNYATLVPSQQATINHKNKIETKEVDTSDYLAWMDGRFSYKNMLFSEIVKDLSRRFNYNFKIVDAELKNERFTIKLAKETNLLDMIKALNEAGETILKVKLDIQSGVVLITKYY